MFELSAGTIFILSAILIFVNIGIFFSIGFHYGKRSAQKKFITAIISKLDLQHPEELIKAVGEAKEKQQLLEAEQDSLVAEIRASAERLKKG